MVFYILFLWGSLDPFSACDDLLAQDPGGYHGPKCIYQKGREPGHGDTARQRLENLVTAQPQRPWLHFYLGNLAQDHGQADAADHYQRALGLFRDGGDELGQFFTAINLHRLHLAARHWARAETVLRQAEQTASNADRPKWIATAARERAALLTAKGSLVAAQNVLARLYAGWTDETPYNEQRDVLLSLGDVHDQLGDPNRARHFYRHLMRLAQAAGDPYAHATARYQDYLSHMMAGPWRETTSAWARETASALLHEAEALNHRGLMVRAHYDLGLLHQGAPADHHLSAGLNLAREMGDTALIGLMQRAKASRTIQQPEQAQRLLEAAGDTTSGDVQASLARWCDQLFVDWETLPAEVATTRSLALLDELETVRLQQSTDLGRAGFLSHFAFPYYIVSGRLLAEHQHHADRTSLEQSFAVVERLRAQSFRDRVSRDTDPSLKRPNRKPAGNSDTTQPISLTDVQKALAADEAMLSFQLAYQQDPYGRFAGGSQLWVITRDRVHTVPLQDRVVLEDAVAVYRDLLTSASPPPLLNRAARDLYHNLLAEGVATLTPNITRLVIIPDGALARLPFPMLRASDDAPPLGATFNLSVVPSAAFWRYVTGKTTRTNTTRALVLADPAFSPRDLKALRQIEENQSRGLAKPARVLPHARKEGRSVAALLGAETVLWLGAEAGKERLLNQDPTSYGIIHLAAHAMVDEHRAEQAAVLLAGSADGASGLLTAAEIEALDFSGKLIVLSTCSSADGATYRGEGVMSLARAFLRAGAAAVVATLLPVSDAGGVALFPQFYRGLHDGLSVAEAVRARYPKQDNPDAWHSLTVFGNGNTTPFPGGFKQPNRATASFWLWLGLFVGIGVVVVGRLRGRHHG